MDDTGDGIWTKMGNFSRFQIMGCGEKRRLVDPVTGDIYREYTIPVDRKSTVTQAQENPAPPLSPAEHRS